LIRIGIGALILWGRGLAGKKGSKNSMELEGGLNKQLQSFEKYLDCMWGWGLIGSQQLVSDMKVGREEERRGSQGRGIPLSLDWPP
jgi:hypothetical protein